MPSPLHRTTSLLNPFEQPGRWYKAALHVHTTTSDGAQPPRGMTEWYRRLGYQVVVLTDHFKTNDITGLGRKNFLVISGMEYHPPLPAPHEGRHHLVAVHVPKEFAFPPRIAKNANACIRAVHAAGGESFLAHPYWCHHRFDQYAYLKGLVAAEVFNSTCDHIGRADSECDWSHQLDTGRLLPGVAVDDSHGDQDATGRACTWLKMRSLSPEAVLEALRTGCGYSSTGPVLEDFRVEDGQVMLTCSPAASVYFVVHNTVAGAAHHAGEEPIRSLTRPLPAEWTCFRAVVVDETGRKAWSNPIRLTPQDRARFRSLQRSRNRQALRTLYPLTREAGSRNWRPLELDSAANRPVSGKGAALGHHELRHLPAGRRVLHGVPFRILEAQTNQNRVAVVLASARQDRSIPREITVPVSGTFRAIYLLHAAAYVPEHRILAEYAFVYKDGSRERMPVLGLGPNPGTGKPRAALEGLCRIQDWYPTHPHLDQPHAHPVPIASPKNPFDRRYLYTTEWVNPRPHVPLKEIRLKGDPESGAVVLVLAATGLVYCGIEGV